MGIGVECWIYTSLASAEKYYDSESLMCLGYSTPSPPSPPLPPQFPPLRASALQQLFGPESVLSGSSWALASALGVVVIVYCYLPRVLQLLRLARTRAQTLLLSRSPEQELLREQEAAEHPGA